MDASLCMQYIRESLITKMLDTVELSVPAGLEPRAYLKFAVTDLNGVDSERCRVNAVSNAKRALHFQIDLIADAFGFKALHGRTQPSFPNKLDFCISCGIVGPQILRKLNRLRNTIEHYYYIPTREETEDFVDVVELFLSATDRFLRNFPTEIDLEPDDNTFGFIRTHGINITMEPGIGILLIKLRCLAISVDEFHRIAAEKEVVIETEGEWYGGTKISGKITKELAYALAASNKYTESTVTISVLRGETYFSWVSLLNEKSK